MNPTKTHSHRLPKSTLLLLVLVVVMVLMLCTLCAYRFALRGSFGGEEPQPSVQLSADVTEPAPQPSAPVVTPDGVSGSVLCLADYTVSAQEAAARTQQVVASWDGQELTNSTLQIYYLNALQTHKRSGSQEQPDYTLPLEAQLCPLGEGALSWQHYFLQQAIKDWQTVQILRSAAQEPRPVTAQGFKPNETDDLHGKYVAKELPVNGFLFQDQPCYTPNKMHQAYLDDLEQTMQALARELGYSSLEDCVESVSGGLLTTQEVVQAARDYNFGYMYFTEESYGISVSDEDAAAYAKAHTDQLPGGYTVDIRQILLVPQGAEVAADGTVKATEAQWESCKKSAEEMMRTFGYAYLTRLNKAANFARFANENSMDAGSKINGGGYSRIQPGQLIDQLDQWCFDSARQEEDIAILRSPLGYHIVMFCGRQNAATEAAREALAQQRLLEQVEARRGKGAMQVDYAAAALWADTAMPAVAPVDALYPDVAHERFPEVMVYFQQDFMFSPYGGSYVGRGGCGITTMAMLATYMTDTILTPHELAARYGNYHDASGTMGELFRYTPAEMGFYLAKNTTNMKEIIAALENGQMVISLQHLGHFTRGGHYLLLQRYYPDDDTFQVRDSNIYNYGRLEGHQVDKFTRGNILSGSAAFYIMQKKITRIPACVRCGGTFDQTAPEKLFNLDYVCPKCSTALARQEAFLRLMGV